MAQQTPGYVISAATHSAALFRQAFDAPLGRRGVLGVSEYKVTQQASPNMTVIVGPGRAAILGSQGVIPSGMAWSTQGSYFVENDANTTVTLSASNPTNPRIDVVYVAVQDAFYSGAANQVVLAVATGTPSGSPAVPAIPANAIALANIAVAANATSIVNANITQRAGIATTVATALGAIMPVPNATYPASPYLGQYVDDATLGLLRWNGTTWAQSAPGLIDTGWQAITVKPGQTGGTGVDVPSARRIGDIVYLTGQIINAGGWTGTYQSIATLPGSNFAPPNEIRLLPAGFTSGTANGNIIRIVANTDVTVAPIGAPSGTLYLSGLSYPAT